MEKTKPALSYNEEPLSKDEVELIFSHFSENMILVGGQALGYWMDRFDIQSERSNLTNDIDAIGVVEDAKRISKAIRAKLEIPKKNRRTSIVAQLQISSSPGKHKLVDLVHLLYTVNGLKKSNEFTRKVVSESVVVEIFPGKFMRVMDPFNLLDSRVQNAVGLIDLKGGHVVTQASLAIEVARHALLKIASSESYSGRVGQKIQKIFQLANSQAGRGLLKFYGLEVLDAIDVETLKKICPKNEIQLIKVSEKMAERKGKLYSPKSMICKICIQNPCKCKPTPAGAS